MKHYKLQMLGKDEYSQISKRLNAKTAAALRSANKEAKLIVNSTWQPVMGPIPLTLSEIKKQMPTNLKFDRENWNTVFENTREKFDTRNPQHVKKLFGNAVTPLTMDLAKKFLGKRLWVVAGQRWWDAIDEYTCNDIEEKMKLLDEFTLVKVVPSGYIPWSNSQSNSQSNSKSRELLVIDHSFGRNEKYTLYEAKSNDGILSIGSGADPVFIFTKQGVERYTGTPRTIFSNVKEASSATETRSSTTTQANKTSQRNKSSSSRKTKQVQERTRDENNTVVHTGPKGGLYTFRNGKKTYLKDKTIKKS